MIMIGYAAKKIGLLKPEDSVTLNKIVVNIAIPCTYIPCHVQCRSFEYKNTDPHYFDMYCNWYFMWINSLLIFKARGYPKKTRWTLVGTSTLFNSGFLGYPVILGIFGAGGLVRAVFYDMGSTILFLCLGILFILIFGGKYTSIIRRTLLFPPLWGIILGILANILNFDTGVHTLKRLRVPQRSSNSYYNDIPRTLTGGWRIKKLFRCSILGIFDQIGNIPNNSRFNGFYFGFKWS